MKPAIPILFLAALLPLLGVPADASACTVCHSKNPKMVRMHEALGLKDCFVCHGPSAKKTNDPISVQMTSDERCVLCHNGNSARPLSTKKQ